jgi:hypothetical protein
MKMNLTDQQRELLSRRKAPDLKLSEFLEVTLLQIRVQIVERGLNDQFNDRVEEFERRIKQVGPDPLVQKVGQLNADLNAFAREVLAIKP